RAKTFDQQLKGCERKFKNGSSAYFRDKTKKPAARRKSVRYAGVGYPDGRGQGMLRAEGASAG
ncbi:MAG: hypothetical protein MUQ99_08065, partial [Pseudomonadales bacterium]|nr:hypothetical protein [Pseudomonadales bacterium]